MSQKDSQFIAVIGVGARMPGAPDAQTFFKNICDKICSITDVPPDRWDPAMYWDPDPKTPDKTYSRIGGFLDSFKPPLRKWRIPPMVARSVDDTQLLALDVTDAALADAGLTADRLPRERCAVILGNAIGGDLRETTSARMTFRIFEQYLQETTGFADLSQDAQDQVLAELRERLDSTRPAINEDTMAGELSNVVAGRVAAAYRLTGPNYTVDAACASSLAALSAAVGALRNDECDLAITGGVDRNMCASGYVKFCKTFTLSARGSTPFDVRADGFVMGEGGGVLILKRLKDAVADGDRIRAVIRGVGGSSDGGAKGLTAPSSEGQLLALRRAYADAGVAPETVGLIEAHGTSTQVGDATEVETLCQLLDGTTLPGGPMALSSVKSNIGHLKSAAGAASLVKAVLALDQGVLPPTAGFETPIEALRGTNVPVRVQTELEDWNPPEGIPRRAGVSAFGFGGTNFHVVLEEHRPEAPLVAARSGAAPVDAMVDAPGAIRSGRVDYAREMAAAVTLPEVGLFRLGAPTREALARQVSTLRDQVDQGESFEALTIRWGQPIYRDAVRAAITAADTQELTERIDQLTHLLDTGKGTLKLAGAGTHLAEGPAPEMAFVFPGQGSQYVGMLDDLRGALPSVSATLAEADAVMTPILGRPLTDYLFGRTSLADEAPASAAAMALQQTAVTQPAVLAADVALLRVFADLGLAPDAVAGHSLGEYAACVAAGVMPLDRALRIVAARGQEMTGAVPEGNDPGQMAVVAAPAEQVEEILERLDGYVVAANKNCPTQTVIAGASDAVQQAMASFESAGLRSMQIPVSHAFHSRVVSAASAPLREVLQREGIRPARRPIYSNVTADLYPTGEKEVLDLLARQVASPVEWIGIIENMYERGVRTFVEIGPKKALAAFTRDILAKRPHRSIHTNHPKKGGPRSLVEALALLSADGQTVGATRLAGDRADLGQASEMADAQTDAPRTPEVANLAPITETPVWITGVAAGLPGGERLFDDGHLDGLLAGKSLLDRLDTTDQQAIVDQRIERIVKSADGTGTLERVDQPQEVMTWVGRGGALDLVEDYRLAASWDKDRDDTTRMGVAAAFEVLRDGWLPLVEQRRAVSNGRTLGEGFRLPAALGEDTGVIFASAFAGYEKLLNLAGRDRTTTSFPRNTLLQILGLGHAHIAEVLGAMGPNTLINAACASTTTAVAMAQDWIRNGRCSRVVVVGADNVTSPTLLPWIGGGFLALGAATTERDLDHAAVPFGRNRNGMIIGMGAVALLVESAESAQRRGVRPRAEIIATRLANSASHPLRLRPNHIASEVDRLVESATAQLGIDRATLARDLVFMSHETYTPARGGSAQAEVDALRRAFGEHVGEVLVVNTKGYTGHAMAAGIEDAAVVAGLWSQSLPPVANLNDPDPEFDDLTFHKGGPVQRRYALRLAAGFGSQIALTLYRRPEGEDPRVDESVYREFLADQCGVDQGAIVRDRRILRARDARRSTDETLPDALTLAQRRDQQKQETRIMSQQETTTATAQTAARSTTETAARSTVTVAEVLARLQGVVAERTGYDLEELEPDLELEADLGIDTVKQAEIVGELRETYHLERDDAFRLADYPTLEALADYVVCRVRPALDNEPKPETATLTETVTVTTPEPATVTATVTAPEPATVTATVTVTVAEVLARLQGVVAERTGYDLEELEPDLELEADLGIDTVKQAEIVGELREAYHLERDDAFRLADYPTLEALADYVVCRVRPALDNEPKPETATLTETATVTTPEPVTATATATETTTVTEVLAKLQGVVAERTGYDLEELEPDLELEADLGIDTVKQAEIVGELREAYHLERDDAFRLADYPTLEALADYVAQRVRPATAIEPTSETTTKTEPATETTTVTEVLAKLQGVVAERTGYDLEELEPDLELEADLGIDTVKQAEIVGELREAYHLERDDAFRLADYPTLEALADYVVCRVQPAPDASVVTASGPATVSEAPPENEATPVPMETDLGDGFRISRISFTPGNVNVTAPDLAPLGRVLVVGSTIDRASQVAEGLLGPDTRSVYLPTDRLLSITEEALTEELRRWVNPAPLQGVINLLGWETAPPDGGEASPAFFRLARALERCAPTPEPAQDPTHVKRAPVSFLLTVLSLSDDAQTGGCPTHETGRTGALAGLTRALSREWTGATVRVVGVTAPQKPEQLGALLARELRISRRSTDVVWRDDTPYTLELGGALKATPLPLDGATMLITGGSGGLGALLARHLAKRGCNLVLSGLDTLPEARIATPPSRSDIRDVLKAAGTRPTPALINRELSRHDREQALATLMHELTQAGATVRYLRADLTDGAQIRAMVADIRNHEGHLDMVIHAAGMERSRPLAHKSLTEFETVFDCKATAGQGLWSEIQDHLESPPRRFVAFSSVAGLFGNAGQTDYASANAALTGLVTEINRTEPRTAALSVHWTGWDDVGMTANSPIRDLLIEHGVRLLPPDLGVRVALDLLGSDLTGEVLVAGPLGELAGASATDLATTPTAEAPQAATLSTEAPQAATLTPQATTPTAEALQAQVAAPAVSIVRDPDGQRATLRMDLSPDDPWLADHAVEGVPLLPAVAGLELMARAAASLVPGARVTGLRNARFQRPLKVQSGRRITAIVEATLNGVPGRVLTALTSERINRAGRLIHQDHFTAEIETSPGDAASPETRPPLHLGALDRHGPEREEIYHHFFHGPAFQVLDSIRLVGSEGLVARGRGKRLALDADASRLAPLAIEAALQAAGFHALLHERSQGLPATIGQLTLTGAPADIEGARELVLRVRATGSGSDPDGILRHRFDVDVLSAQGGTLMVCRDVVLIQRAAVEETALPTTSSLLEVVEIAVDSLGHPDSKVVDLEAELGPAERRQAVDIAHPGRRLDWIAGRLAAKELVRLHLRDRYGVALSRRRVEVATDPGGAPVPWVPSQPCLAALLPALSITHACGRAMALGVPTSDPGVRVGVDLAPVEARPDSFEKQWLTDGEQRLLEGTDTDGRVLLVSQMWALKEAASKALGLGLQLATAEMEIEQLDGDGTATMRFSGLAKQRFDDLGATGVRVAVLDWHDAVLAWARLDLGGDTDTTDDAPPLQGLRETHIQPAC